MEDTESTQYLLKLLQTKCDIIREWADKLRLKADVRGQNMLNIIVSQADQIMCIANDYSKGNLSLETEDGEPATDKDKLDTSSEAFDEADDKGKADIINKVLTEPEDDNHFGEEQAEGLDDLLAGLKDSPHDDRW